MINVEAAGGVVHRIINREHQVLLICRNGVWDLPKGKKEKGETLKECARREVAEETGIPPPRIEHFLLKTTHQYKRASRIYNKETHWFAMETEKNVTFIPQQKEGITEVAWVELTTSIDKVAFINLRKLLNMFHGSV